jgi:hypothetical protein
MFQTSIPTQTSHIVWRSDFDLSHDQLKFMTRGDLMRRRIEECSGGEDG